MFGIMYATREQVKSALDAKETAYANTRIDSAIKSSSRNIESMMHRVFYPWTGTRYFDWPNRNSRRQHRLWLDNNELISLTTFVSGDVTIPASAYFLEPVNEGPPYTYLEIDLSSASSMGSGDTYQRANVLTGVYGYRLDETAVGAVSEALDASETGIDVTDSVSVGVGSLIRIENERIQVTGKSMKDTTQNIGANLTAAQNDITVAVSDGTTFVVGETILVDSERMLIVDIAGNNLTVKRAWDGSVLAAHTSPADIYAPRTLTVERGVLGTTAATHVDTSTIQRFDYPELVNELCVALSLNTVLQQQSGYAREVGEGDNRRESSGRGIRQIMADCFIAHGRKVRMRAV